MSKGGQSSVTSDALQQQLTAARVAFQSGDFTQTLSHCQFIISQEPGHVKALRLLCLTHMQMRNPSAALPHAEQLVAVAPDNGAYWNDLGLALFGLERLDEAEAAFDKSIAADPSLMEPRANKAAIQVNRGDFQDARETLEAVLSLDPQNINALVNLGVATHKLGRIEEALGFFEKALERNPDSPDLALNRLSLLNYSWTRDFAEVSVQAKRYWDIVRRSDAVEPRQHHRDRDAADKPHLRIGYVSGDFRVHSVGHLFKAAFEGHDRTKFETVLYSNNPYDDDLSQDLKSVAGAWRDIQNKSDDDVATLIQEDRIDILVDLSGRTEGGRLNVFRRKPAPVQMTWLGYYATTGLSEIDYIIADTHVLPTEDEHLYTETPLRLPHTYFCFQPPALSNGAARKQQGADAGLTFGSFNNIYKFNADVLQAWASILNAVPNSRLVVKSQQIANEQVADSTRKFFAEHGVDEDRLSVYGRVSREEHFAMYDTVDIALDPFPYGGGLTTLEALSMGVPVITMSGDRWVSRMGPSVLSTIGLTDLVADNRESYIEKALDLAGDSDRRLELSDRLRATMESSALCDAAGFTRDLERLFQQAWRSWCSG